MLTTGHKRERAAETGAAHRYRAFGLEIESDLAVAEFEPGQGGPPDLRIVRRDLGPLPSREAGAAFHFGEAEARMAFPEVGQFRIRDGMIEAEGAPDADDELLSLPLLGPVMALMLHRRGQLVLHGSALEVNGAGAVFLGDKEAGKSTTAAAFVHAGHRLVTDDVVAVSLDGDGAQIASAYPQIKLMHDAAAALHLEGSTALPQPHPEFIKTRQRLAGAFSHAPVTPRALYVLERGEEARVETLAPAEAMMSLMRFSYAVRFGDALVHGPAAAQHMRQCAALASRAPVRRLTAPRGVERLGELVALVERDVS